MSQENSTSEKKKEARNKIVLGVLLLVLAVVVYFQFFSGSEAPAAASRPAPANTENKNAVASGPAPQNQAPQRGGTPERIVSEPLDLASMQIRNDQSSGTGRNIFVYPTPTPEPPPPPPSPTPTPVPPPITIFSINPGGVIARTGDFTLTVFGSKIPQDPQGFLNGATYPTTYISPGEARINVPADAIRSPGNFSVTLRSQSDAKLYSNPYSLNVAQPPDPPYRYVGLIEGKTNSVAVLKSTTDDKGYNVKNGDLVERRWKIVKITKQKIEIEDTNYKLDRPHTINYSGEVK